MSAIANPALAEWLEARQRARANVEEQHAKPCIGEGLSRGPRHSRVRAVLSHDGDRERWTFRSRLLALVRLGDA